MSEDDSISSWCMSRGAYNTEYFELPDNTQWHYDGKFCSYCGKKMEKHTEIEDRESIHWFRCSCESAQKEVRIRVACYDIKEKAEREEIRILKDSPKIDKEIIKEMEYQHKLFMLQREYDKVPEDIRFRKF